MTFVAASTITISPSDDAIGRKDGDRVVHEVAQQEGDRRIADHEGQQRGDRRGPRRGAAGLAHVAQLEQPREDDRRHREQERVARRGGAVEVQEQAGGDRGARARHARDERQGLEQADDQPVAARDVRQLAVAPRDGFGAQHHEGEEDERRADELERAELVLDRVLERQPEDRDRDGAEDDVPAQSRVGVLRRALAGERRARPRRADRPQVAPEVDEHGRQRPELDHGGEGRPGVVPAEERRHDPQVGGARDGQELGQPLHDPEDDGLKGVHGDAGGYSDRRLIRQHAEQQARGDAQQRAVVAPQEGHRGGL